MGALSGGITLRRYRVAGDAPKDWKESFEKGIRAHVLVPINVEGNEDKSLGWSSIFDENDLDLSLDKFFYEAGAVGGGAAGSEGDPGR